MIGYLSGEQVLQLNLLHGGPGAGLRDRDVLEGVLSRPQSGVFDQEFYPALLDKAAILLEGLAGTQAFLDGNKRTAWVACNTFLVLNGQPLREVSPAVATPFVLAVAAGMIEFGETVEWLAAHVSVEQGPQQDLTPQESVPESDDRPSGDRFAPTSYVTRGTAQHMSLAGVYDARPAVRLEHWCWPANTTYVKPDPSLLPDKLAFVMTARMGEDLALRLLQVSREMIKEDPGAEPDQLPVKLQPELRAGRTGRQPGSNKNTARKKRRR